jgi:hypothetical protein
LDWAGKPRHHTHHHDNFIPHDLAGVEHVHSGVSLPAEPDGAPMFRLSPVPCIRPIFKVRPIAESCYYRGRGMIRRGDSKRKSAFRIVEAVVQAPGPVLRRPRLIKRVHEWRPNPPGWNRPPRANAPAEKPRKTDTPPGYLLVWGASGRALAEIGQSPS